MTDSHSQHLLPTDSEQDWLLAAVADSIATWGAGPWAVAYVVNPTDKDFPEPWRSGTVSVARVLRRLLRYAGRAELSVDVKFHDRQDESPMSFSRVDAGVLHFDCVSARGPDPVSVVAVAAREVIRGLRVADGLRVEDADEEERRIDVGAVHLGFGALILHASPTPAVAFLLGLQAVTRGLSRSELRSMRRGMRTEHAASSREAVRLLQPSAGALRERLGVPDPASFPPAPDVDQLTSSLDGPAQAGLSSALVTNFRVRASRAQRLGAGLFVAVLVAGGIAMGPMEVGVSVPQVVVLALAVGLVGAAVGRVWSRRAGQ